MPDRRRFVALLAGIGLVPQWARRSAHAAENDLAPIIARLTGGRPVQAGKVTVDTPLLADNGHSVPVKFIVDSPMTANDYVQTITVLSDRNPRPVVATYHLGPRAGRAQVATRVRLNGSQRLWAVARLSDGSFWSGHADVVVTESACLDDT